MCVMATVIPKRADKLEDAYRTLSPAPLVGRAEFEAFYRTKINAVRGDDLVARMALGLRRAWGGLSYKALLMGHAGVGKSTEMTRLTREVETKYRPIRFSVTEQLDPISFQPFDVLLLMLIEVIERTAKPLAEGGAGQKLSDDRLREIYDWFAVETETAKRATQAGMEASAGIGVTGDSWWAKTLGLFGSIKGEFKYASTRETTTIHYRLSRLDTLLQTANRALAECNKLLRKAADREWLFLGEDFDKAGVAPRKTEDFFITYSNVLRQLDTHFIFNIPIALGYSHKAVALPIPQNSIFNVPDIMVFKPDHTAHREGRAAVEEVLEARLDPGLFAPAQMERLIVACGGNLRNLFAMTSHAADTALLRGASLIEAQDVTPAIRQLRNDYERRLGESVDDIDVAPDGKLQPIPYEKKAARLLKIYNGDPEAKMADPILYSLLRSRAVQEFNGERWFGVHPLVVDILASQGRFSAPAPGGSVPGGTF